MKNSLIFAQQFGKGLYRKIDSNDLPRSQAATAPSTAPRPASQRGSGENTTAGLLTQQVLPLVIKVIFYYIVKDII